VTRVGILATGRLSDAIIRRHGNFSQMFCKCFSGQPELEFSVFPVAFGAPVPKPSARDAWIITGSSAAVYEDHPWLPPMREFVRQAIDQTIPTLGICFGHQLMAQAFGGTVAEEIIEAAERSFDAIAPDSKRLLPLFRNFLIQRHPS
jgi:GMP synthase-like glutamine amidotransferase